MKRASRRLPASTLSIPSTVSAVDHNDSELDLYTLDGLRLGSVTAEADWYNPADTTVVVRLDVGVPFIGHGDLLDPRWRSLCATDYRLLAGAKREDRTKLLRFLNDVAVAWDCRRGDWTRASMTTGAT